MADQITTGSTIDFRLQATKDGSVWDLTGGSVTLRLIDPDGMATDHAATVSDPTNGIADYTTATADLYMVGTWQKQWRIVVSGLTDWSERESFYVSQGG